MGVRREEEYFWILDMLLENVYFIFVVLAANSYETSKVSLLFKMY